MPSKAPEETDKAAADWLTKPIYKILIVALVMLELLRKEMDGGIINFFHIVLWIGLGWIVIMNIAYLFSGLKKKNKDSAEDESEA